MPVITGLQSSLVGAANSALATAFFPRFLKSFWPQLCRSTLSTRLVEPFALDGSAPLLRAFNGTLKSYGLKSWSYNSPNLLFKNFEEIGREEFEMDQIGTVRKRVGQHGVRLAHWVDYLTAKRILNADSASSASVVYKGQTYYTTFEQGIPLFATNHNMYDGSTQSNIITGSLPSGAGTVPQNDIPAMAQAMLKDLELIIDQFASYKDDKGANLYPDFDPQKSLTIVVPPVLRPVADLAFMSDGALIGGSPGNSGSTGSTTFSKGTRVKRVISPGLLRGCIDVESDDDTVTVSPKYPYQYYAFVDDDYVGPLYFQRFRPKKGGEYMPVGSDPEAEAEAILNATDKGGFKVTAEAADMYAATEIDTNLGALGQNAQESVVKKESFFISARSRGNVNYGFWPTAMKIDPAGQSA